MRQVLSLALLLLAAGVNPAGAAGISIALQSASGGVTVSGSSPNCTASVGNVNGLGAGTPGAGVSLFTTGVSNGVLYTTPYNIIINNTKGSPTWELKAYVSGNFIHPSILIVYSCAPLVSCSTASDYSTMSTNAGAQTTLVPTNNNYPFANTPVTFTAYVGVYIANSNGAGVFTGSDSATIYFSAHDITNNKTVNCSLGLSATAQTAVQLRLATAGGLTISPASDYSADFGTVNGIGINPAAGVTMVSAAGGVIYSPPTISSLPSPAFCRLRARARFM